VSKKNKTEADYFKVPIMMLITDYSAPNFAIVTGHMTVRPKSHRSRI